MNSPKPVFIADTCKGLKHEGKISLNIFVEACKEDGVTPFRIYSGKFQVRVGSKTHKSITMAAKKSGRSINSWIVEALEKEAAEELGEKVA
jgi:predicted HicB family RNase H-like nuclease